MNRHDTDGKIREIVTKYMRMSCGLIIISPRYHQGYNKDVHGDITLIVTETNDEIELWQMNNLLDGIKQALYQSQLISNIYCTFSGFNQVTLRCYYAKK